MRERSRSRRCHLWLLAVAGLVLAGFAVVPPAAAENGYGEFDHLQCFDVVTDPRTSGRDRDISLETGFSFESRCYIEHKARLYCARAIKNEGSDGRGEPLNTDFLCYALTCPDPVKRDLDVEDQFFSQTIRIQGSRWLCTPVVED
jgi:hypothetical protein